MRNPNPARSAGRPVSPIRGLETQEAREARAWVARRLAFEGLLADLERAASLR